MSAPWTPAHQIAFVRRWRQASQTTKPLPVPSTPLGLRRKDQ